ncbi:MAG: MATE family efflux transporter [Bacillota bacterium]
MTKSIQRLFSLSNNPIRKDVLNIAWPVLAEMLIGSLFSMVDMMMLGRMKNTAAAAASVAAVGVTNQPIFIGLALVQALNIGGTAMVARYIGGNQWEKAEDTVKHVLLLNLLFLSIPLSILGLLFTDQIMAFMGAKTDTLTIGRHYFQIMMLGFVFQSFNFGIAASLRGAGDTKLPMKINLRVNFFNVIGNAILIYGLLGFPALGVTGAAISTAFSHLLATIILTSYLLRGKTTVKIGLNKKFRFSFAIMSNLIRIGVPASLEQMALRLGIMFFVKIVASLGTVAYAAHQICLSIVGLSFHPGQSFGIATSSLVGKSLGAEKPDQAHAYAREARKIGSIISSIMALGFFIFGEELVSLYSRDQEIIYSASTALNIIAFVQPFQSSQLILAGGLRGAGDTLWPLLSTFTGVVIIRSLLCYLFVIVLGYGLAGAWLAVLVDQFIRWILIYHRFQSGKWKYVKLR